ncbi:hypothetical protein ACS8E2_05470 [Psychrobacter glaciei]|uniref:hypothetical protein n=1 Tax=Psychrobacter glaciei TaxID=619771 RepID=UPI003F454CF7|tara:strand:- start:954 stop:1133 length:180 start_codon:yes stop_codon:yes gene_type:complete
MSTSQSVIEQFNKEFGIKQLTAMDNTGLFCNSSNYSKKSKQLVLDQQAKAVRKVMRVKS